jgi:hypothetical protein
MRGWLTIAFAHLLLAWGVLGLAGQFVNVYRHGWRSGVGLVNAPTGHIAATFFAAALVCWVVGLLAIRIARLWRHWYRRFTSMNVDPND